MVGLPRSDALEASSWQIDDVRAVDVVTGVGRRLSGTCGHCGSSFTSDWHILLSVAREGGGGRTVVVCERCARDNWAVLQARLAAVAAMLSAADFVRGQHVG